MHQLINNKKVKGVTATTCSMRKSLINNFQTKIFPGISDAWLNSTMHSGKTLSIITQRKAMQLEPFANQL